LPETLTFLKIGLFFQSEIIIPKKCKTISLTKHNKLIQNLPEHIEQLYIDTATNFVILQSKISFIDNLPTSLKEIIVLDNSVKNLLKNIPYGTIITVKNNY
jgi:hypothetical protein